MIRTLTFTETDTGLVYTAVTSVPPGGRILDIYTETDVAWTAATAALNVGDSDAIDSLCAGGKTAGGTDWGNGAADGPISSAGPGKMYPNGSQITAVCTATVPGGPTGISRVVLLIELPGTHRAASVV